MPTDIAQLGIKIEADDIRTAVKELDRLEEQSKRNERQTDKLSASSKKLMGVMVALAGSVAVNKFIKTAGAFESMNASLVTVTGSTENATKAMAMIRDMAVETPFQVSQLTESFIKLKALGLDPSAAAIRSYGNTASAMGKDLNQMIEAVADATTGEFERLKEFGIKSRSEGENVSFTFQGITTTVKKNSEEISQYLRDIGDVQFAGAMARQMDTINGKISNLGDQFDNFFVSIAEQGGGSAVKSVLDGMISSMDFLTKFATNAVIEFNDLGSALGAYAAIASKILSLEFDAAGDIIDMREKQREKVDQQVEALWRQKIAQESVNESEEKNNRIKDKQASKEEELRNLRLQARAQQVLDMEAWEAEDNERLWRQFEEEKRIEEEKAVMREEINSMVLNAQSQFGNSMLALGNALAGDNEKLQKAMFYIERAIAVGRIIVDTNVAAMKAASAYASLGPEAALAAAGRIKAFGYAAAAATATAAVIQGNRQGGGAVSGGQSYWVGENGPEIYTPTGNGSIINNNDMRKMGGANVTFNISAVDTAGMEEMVNRNKAVFYNAVSQQMYENGQSFS